MGSTFKPIVYTAAIDRGYTPVVGDRRRAGGVSRRPGQPLYSPQNYDRTYEGAVTLRRALEQSRNVPTVKLLDGVGPAVVIDYARRFGFTNPMQPYLSLALGAAEATPLEATSAPTPCFPRQGVHMTPYEVLRVLDRQGNVLEENRPRAAGRDPRRHGVRDDQPAARRRDARHRGLCRRARLARGRQDRDDGRLHRCVVHRLRSRDHDWRLGGLRREEVAGPRARPATTAALPIWLDVDEGAPRPARPRAQKPEFAAPGNIVVVPVDKADRRAVGRRATRSARRSSPARSQRRAIAAHASTPRTSSTPVHDQSTPALSHSGTSALLCTSPPCNFDR